MTDRLYRCIAADPPWPENGGGGRGAQNHYATMSPKRILATIKGVLYGSLLAEPVIERTGCHLWLWSTDTYLPDALRMLPELGFRYVATWQWVKLQDSTLQLGLGQYSRKCHEHLVFGVLGAAMVPPPESRPPSVILAPRTPKHSEKPDAAYVGVIEAVSPGPRLEMFARQSRPGWDGWGNEFPTNKAKASDDGDRDSESGELVQLPHTEGRAAREVRGD